MNIYVINETLLEKPIEVNFNFITAKSFIFKILFYLTYFILLRSLGTEMELIDIDKVNKHICC